jgi:hypothetical protein
MFLHGLHEILPIFYELSTILATTPATSCSAERAFSGLRRIKTYLRSTMRQDRLKSIAVINIERSYANRVLQDDIETIINLFGRRNNRNSYFF